jgi:DNA-binding NtrC family response regulator
MNKPKISKVRQPSSASKSREIPPHRILVVDDDKDICRLNADILKCSGYHVDTVEDGAIAWEKLQKQDYDLIITDNDMPTLSGMELLKKLRAARMPLPVIMATGKSPKDIFSQLPQLKPAVMLQKPYTVDELMETVKEALDATENPNEQSRSNPDGQSESPAPGLDLS